MIGRSGVKGSDTGAPRRPKKSELMVTNVRRFPAWRRTMRGEVGVSTPPPCRETPFVGQHVCGDEQVASYHEVDVKWTVTAVRPVMMKLRHQCPGVSSYWHHLSDVCCGGGVVVSAAVATTLLNPRFGARKTLQRNHVFHSPLFSGRGICSSRSTRLP